MMISLKKAPILVILFILTNHIFASSSIKIKDDWFIIDKEPFLIKGIGYSNCRPHEQPNSKKIDLEQVRKEFKVIREAGFNTVRTWTPLSLEELKIAEEMGLYVIQGIWIEYRENYTDPSHIEQIVSNLNSVIKESSKASNVLLYLVGNEPQPRQVFSAGMEKTNQFFLELKKSIKNIAPKAMVAMSNWVQCDFLNDNMWDVCALNIYIYNPESVSHAMGYRGYVNWLKRTHARKRPLMITEFGLSVSKTGVGHKGYGGNSEEEQKEGVMYMYQEALAGGATGACVFEFIDEWWKNFNHPSDQKIHEPADPEEWFGICYYDEEGNFYKRPVYEALKNFNQAVCIDPVDSAVVKGAFPVEVYVEENIETVKAKLGENGEWKELKRKSPHWFKGKVSCKDIEDGKATLYYTAKNDKDEEFENSKTVVIHNHGKKMKVPYKVEIILDKDVYYTKNIMSTVRLRFKTTDSKGKIIPNQKVFATVYEPVLNQRLVLNLITDEEGVATHIYNINEEGVLTVSAGVPAFPDQEGTDPKMLLKYGECKHIKIYYEEKQGN